MSLHSEERELLHGFFREGIAVSRRGAQAAPDHARRERDIELVDPSPTEERSRRGTAALEKQPPDAMLRAERVDEEPWIDVCFGDSINDRKGSKALADRFGHSSGEKNGPLNARSLEKARLRSEVPAPAPHDLKGLLGRAALPSKREEIRRSHERHGVLDAKCLGAEKHGIGVGTPLFDAPAIGRARQRYSKWGRDLAVEAHGHVEDDRRPAHELREE